MWRQSGMSRWRDSLTFTPVSWRRSHGDVESRCGRSRLKVTNPLRLLTTDSVCVTLNFWTDFLIDIAPATQCMNMWSCEQQRKIMCTKMTVYHEIAINYAYTQQILWNYKLQCSFSEFSVDDDVRLWLMQKWLHVHIHQLQVSTTNRSVTTGRWSVSDVTALLLKHATKTGLLHVSDGGINTWLIQQSRSKSGANSPMQSVTLSTRKKQTSH